jgi:hypothetical protein
MKPQRCKYKRGAYKCGSFAFNLHHESIDQGKTCDKCYWETRALAAEAKLLQGACPAEAQAQAARPRIIVAGQTYYLKEREDEKTSR